MDFADLKEFKRVHEEASTLAVMRDSMQYWDGEKHRIYEACIRRELDATL